MYNLLSIHFGSAGCYSCLIVVNWSVTILYGVEKALVFGCNEMKSL